jgi:hypothetical protein
MNAAAICPPRSPACFRHVSPASHWSYPARPSEFVPKLAKTGEHRPKFLPSDLVEGGRYRWPKPDSIPERH